MISSLSGVQTAVFTALTGDTNLSLIVTGVFDDAPENQALPYLTIGEATEQPFRTFGADGSEIVLTVHAWSQATGMKEVQSMVQRAVQVLDSTALPTIPGRRLVYCNYEHGETMRDPDGITWHAFARFRCITQEIFPITGTGAFVDTLLIAAIGALGFSGDGTITNTTNIASSGTIVPTSGPRITVLGDFRTTPSGDSRIVY